MARNTIIIDIDHHDATKALARIQSLLAWASDGYGITAFDVETHGTGHVILAAADVTNIVRKRTAFQSIVDQHRAAFCPREGIGTTVPGACDCAEYAMGITIIDWILNGAPND